MFVGCVSNVCRIEFEIATRMVAVAVIVRFLFGLFSFWLLLTTQVLLCRWYNINIIYCCIINLAVGWTCYFCIGILKKERFAVMLHYFR